MAVDETQAAQVDSDLVRDKFGKYSLVRHLATGGMAEIYLAEHVGPGGFAKEVVIKRILPHLAKDEQFTAMFLDEARLASQLNHPNIGQIIELGQQGNEHFIAMEFIDGVSLDDLIEAGMKMPVDVALRIVADTLGALDYAHEARGRDGKPMNLVHRDVTPSNVMVSSDGIVKLVDFGVAKAAKKDHKTQTGAVKGKFAYMAPEQIETSEVDRRADVFSVGVVTYELLTGVKPFGEELSAVSRILHEEPEDPREFRPELHESVVQIIRRALSKDREDRYPSARGMLLDIETALRKMNSYSSTREISVVVRSHLGLDVPEDVVIGMGDTGIFAADRSADLLVAAPAAPVTEAEPAPVSVARPTPSDERQPPRNAAPPNRRVIAMAVGAGAAALLFIVTIAALTGSPSAPEEPPTIVLNETAFVEPGADPSHLFDKGGHSVLIDSIPSTRVYRGRHFIGTTPLETRLDRGRHRIELEYGEERKRTAIEVSGSDGYQRRLIDFRAIGEDDDTRRTGDSTEPDEKPKRRSLRSRIRSLF